MMFLVLSIGLFSLALPVTSLVALGNLAVVIRNNKLISTDNDPLTGHANDLWCQASVDNSVAELASARFIRAHDRKSFEATLDEDKKKARLVFGETPVTNGGKYRCEMRTIDGELIYGNMFAYTRPVIHTNGSRKFEVSEYDPTLVEGEELKASEGGTAEIPCPVVGYPTPNVVWYKDGLPLEEGERVSFKETVVVIDKVEKTDAGKYRCVATNQFPLVVDGQEQQFEIKMDQLVAVPASLGWVLPLMIILIILLLVCICIYACSAMKKFNSANYNVARREQTLRREREDEQRRLTKETP